MMFVLGGGKPSAYQIQRSLRFRSSATAYLNRTPSVAGNRRTYTYSAWAKLGATAGATGYLAAWNTATNFNDATGLSFQSGTLDFSATSGGATTASLQTTQLFRDPSSWYHIVVSVDTTQATSSNRVKMYVNGSQITAFSTSTYPALNDQHQVNNTVASYIGNLGYAAVYFDGYLSEVNFIDGQALDPTYFGKTDPITGQWTAKKYTGTYGTNGFYLPFTDTSSTTNLVKDASGNGNNWTPNNISLTAGVTYDSMTDVPLAYGTTDRGNYCTFNPNDHTANSYCTVSDGGLTVLGNTATDSGGVSGTIATTSGKFYWEITRVGTANFAYAGITGVGLAQSANAENTNQGGALVAVLRSSGSVAIFGVTGPTLATWNTAGDVIGVAYDADNGAIYFAKNGVWQNSGVPTSGASKTGAVGTWTAGAYLLAPLGGGYTSGNGANYNFGQRPFSYTPPTGFKALHTGNLPAPAIVKPSTQMQVVLDAGANIKTTSEAVFPGNLLEWIKDRANANNHQLIDTVRGTSAVLQSNTTAAETTYTAPSGSSVGWVWKAGGAAVTNNAGSISSQVSANASAGFSIVTYTGTGANATVGHGLGVAPKFFIIKNRTLAGAGWQSWHAAFGTASNTDYILLNSTGAKGSLGAASMWNGIQPSSSVVSLGSDSWVNQSAAPHVAYCFAEIPGYSKFGSYTGNGSVDGPFVYCGFRPRWVLIKDYTAAGVNWVLIDTARNTYNAANSLLFPDATSAEGAGGTSYAVDFTANGFKVRGNGAMNNNTEGYIFAAFAESPFQYSNAR